MEDHGLAVARHPDIKFDAVGAQRQRAAKGGERVLRGLGGGAPMGDEQGPGIC